MIRRQLAISENHLGDGPAPDFAQAYWFCKIEHLIWAGDRWILPPRSATVEVDEAKILVEPIGCATSFESLYTSGPPSTPRSFDILPRAARQSG
jgi:hypothetical protein